MKTFTQFLVPWFKLNYLSCKLLNLIPLSISLGDIFYPLICPSIHLTMYSPSSFRFALNCTLILHHHQKWKQQQAVQYYPFRNLNSHFLGAHKSFTIAQPVPLSIHPHKRRSFPLANTHLSVGLCCPCCCGYTYYTAARTKNYLL